MSKLPSITSAIPNDLRQFLERVREALGGRGPNRAVTADELVNTGLVKDVGGFLRPSQQVVCGTPPAPSNLSARGAFANVILEWDQPRFDCFAYTEVWASETNNLSQATIIGMTAGSVFAHNIGESASRYYWVRFANTENARGGYNDTNGTLGQTSVSPDYLMELLVEAYGTNSQAPFFQLDEPTVINGVSIPAGTYMKSAFIVDASITNAKIKDLTADKISAGDIAAARMTANVISAANLSVGTIDADRIDVDNLSVKLAQLEEAWITTANVRDAEINAANITDGTIQNARVGDLQSTNYLSGTAGWRIKKDGSSEFNSNALFRGVIDVKSAASGARLEIKNNVIKVYDNTGTLRVKIGDLNA